MARSRNLGQIFIPITASIRGLRSALGKASGLMNVFAKRTNRILKPLGLKLETSLAKNLSSIGSLFRKASVAAAGFAVAIGLSIKKFAEQEAATAKLAASLRMSGDATLATMRSTQQLADQIQLVTTYGDEQIEALAGMASAMTGLTGPALNKLTVAAVGFSSAMNVELKSAFQLISKAVAGETSSMSRYGIVLSETMTAQEKLDHVLRIGEKGFIAAQEQVDTTAGKLTQLKNRFGDLLERIGELAVDKYDFVGFLQRGMDALEGFAANAKELGAVLSSTLDALFGFSKMYSSTFDTLNVFKTGGMFADAAAEERRLDKQLREHEKLAKLRKVTGTVDRLAEARAAKLAVAEQALEKEREAERKKEEAHQRKLAKMEEDRRKKDEAAAEQRRRMEETRLASLEAQARGFAVRALSDVATSIEEAKRRPDPGASLQSRLGAAAGAVARINFRMFQPGAAAITDPQRRMVQLIQDSIAEERKIVALLQRGLPLLGA